MSGGIVTKRRANRRRLKELSCVMAAGDLGEGVVPELAERASSHDTKTTAHCEIGHARQLRDVVGLRQHEKQSWRRGLNELMLIGLP